VDASKLIFDSSVEALLKAGRGRLSPTAAAKVAALGIPLEGKLAPAYPAEAWASCVKVISEDLFPNLDAVEAQRQLAHRTVQQFAEVFVGKALFSLARLMGRERTLQRMTQNFRTGANFIQTRLDTVGEGQWELWISDVSGVPGFYMGLVEGGLKASVGQADELRIKSLEGPACTYEIRHKA
jgi:uncharacterized protein (TIGR02265 family)